MTPLRTPLLALAIGFLSLSAVAQAPPTLEIGLPESGVFEPIAPEPGEPVPLAGVRVTADRGSWVLLFAHAAIDLSLDNPPAAQALFTYYPCLRPIATSATALATAFASRMTPACQNAMGNPSLTTLGVDAAAVASSLGAVLCTAPGTALDADAVKGWGQVAADTTATPRVPLLFSMTPPYWGDAATDVYPRINAPTNANPLANFAHSGLYYGPLRASGATEDWAISSWHFTRQLVVDQLVRELGIRATPARVQSVLEGLRGATMQVTFQAVSIHSIEGRTESPFAPMRDRRGLDDILGTVPVEVWISLPVPITVSLIPTELSPSIFPLFPLPPLVITEELVIELTAHAARAGEWLPFTGVPAEPGVQLDAYFPDGLGGLLPAAALFDDSGSLGYWKVMVPAGARSGIVYFAVGLDILPPLAPFNWANGLVVDVVPTLAMPPL